MTWINKLNVMAAIVATVTVGVCGTALVAPNSEFACVIERFQTLITGSVAGLAALITAGIVYRAAKEPIEARRKEAEERKTAMRTAGAAFILNAVNTIFMSVLHEVGKPEDKRDGRLVVPAVLPDIDVISTQTSAIIKELSQFIGFASGLEANVGVSSITENESNDDDVKFVNESVAQLEEMWLRLAKKLQAVVEGKPS